MHEPLNILMITHHRRYRTRARSWVMAKHLIQRGHRVTLVATANVNRRKVVVSQEEDGLRVVETPDLLWGKLRSGWDLWGLVNRLAFLRGEKADYDLAHCFETRPNTIYPALSFCKRHNLPMFTDWNDWVGRGGLMEVLRPAWYRALFGRMETYYEEAFRSQAVGTTVICSGLGKRAAGLGIDPNRICQISGGTSPEIYPARPKEDCRRHMGYAVEGPILGFASADSHLDVQIVLDALAIVAQQYAGVRLIITGAVSEKVLKAAQQAGVAERLILPGFLPVEELSWCLGSADVFLLPFPDTIYNNGRWPNKIGLYACLGRPTVTNPVGDLRALFQNHAIGLTSEYTPQDFAQKIITLLSNDSLAGQMGETAYQVAMNQLHWKNLIGDLEAFYYHILDMKRGSI